MPKQRWLTDGVIVTLALGLTLAILTARGFGTPGPTARSLDTQGFVLALLTAAPLALRRRKPEIAYGLSAVASLLLLHLNYPLDAPVATAVAAYALAQAYTGAAPFPRAAALLAVNAFVPAVAVAYWSIGVLPRSIATELLAWAAVFAGLWIAGDRSRLRALRLADAEANALRVRAEAEKRAQRLQAESEERAQRLQAESEERAQRLQAESEERAQRLQAESEERARRARAEAAEQARRALAEAEETARRALADAERDRRLAAADERTRIARELHDSAGHAINVILVQAGAARLLHDRDPDRAKQALGTIESVARDTVTDIDRLVRALRDDREDVPADPGALDELIDRHRASGLTIAADLPERQTPLPRSVAWAAYRILQEALTNAARHGAGSAEVAVRFARQRVEIDVTNPTVPHPDPADSRTAIGPPAADNHNATTACVADSHNPTPAPTADNHNATAARTADNHNATAAPTADNHNATAAPTADNHNATAARTADNHNATAARTADSRNAGALAVAGRPAGSRAVALRAAGGRTSAGRAAVGHAVDGRVGLGIVGMRERATLLGGTLTAEPAAGCFRLSAVLPHA
ncbi:histidine kinase [Actinoplanes sp. CA-142083]|uniref:sensor histidine kinase n=1 Tax=Actinoplanes sp. CA-142083 TaxID=3239903 RepID=UPI003D8B43B1